MTDQDRISAWMRILELKIEHAGNTLLKNTGITVMQLRVLKYLCVHTEEAQIADISEFFEVTHTSMIHVINVLEEKGYVYREPIRRSRGKNIRLTERGKQLAKENEDRINRVEDAMLEGMSKEDKEKLLELLKIMDTNLEKHFG